MKGKKIVILAGKGDSSKIVFNALDSQFGIEKIIVEDKENTKKFIKRRIKRLGIFTVVGQILFQLIISKFLGSTSKKRRDEIMKTNNMNAAEIPNDKTINVSSVNSKKTIELLKEINPDLIIVNGTRIISEKVLSTVECPFINTHAGITPKYRGVHGAYWALVNNDAENNGVTVHFVDKGIDTGSVIYQENITVTKQDDFSTYPLIQLASGIKLLTKAIENFFNGTLSSQKERNLESILWYHPTIWGYLYHRIFKGVK